jgi:hypothetical protein
MIQEVIAHAANVCAQQPQRFRAVAGGTEVDQPYVFLVCTPAILLA